MTTRLCSVVMLRGLSVAAVFGLLSATSALAQFAGGKEPAPVNGSVITTSKATIPAAVAASPVAAYAPPSAAQLATVQAWQPKLPLQGPPVPRVAAPAGPPQPGLGPQGLPRATSQTDAPTWASVAGAKSQVQGQAQALAPSSFNLFIASSPKSVIPSGFLSEVEEASTGMSGKSLFMTANWYAAYSNNSGSTWTHVSPFSAFPSADGGFCCDQQAIYEPARDMMLWLLQYIKSGSTSGDRGRERIAVYLPVNAGLSGTGWFYYDLLPSYFGGPATGEWFDYPRLALTKNYLWLAVNVFTTTSDSWTRTVMMRIPLDQLSSGGQISADWISWTANFNFTPIEGVENSMWWASHQNNQTLRVFKWPETSSTITAWDIPISAWNTGSHSCPSADARDWCARSDNRVLAGARAYNRTTGNNDAFFFWNVGQGGSFPKPYIEAYTISLTNPPAAVTRPLIWNSTMPFHYVGASTNGRGDVGLSLFWAQPPNLYPAHALCIADDYSGPPPGWQCAQTAVSTNGPTGNRWGDFVTVRPAYPSTFSWQAVGWTLQGGTGGNNMQPVNMVFGRGRDYPEFVRWYNK